MKKLYFLNEEESNRILNLHRTAIKKQFINEAGPYQDPEVVPGTTTPVTPVTPATPVTPTTPTTPTTIASTGTTTPTGTLTQQLQTLIGVKSDGKFGPKSLQGLKDKLGSSNTTTPTSGTTATTSTSGTTVTTPTSGTTSTGTPTTGNVASASTSKMSSSEL